MLNLFLNFDKLIGAKLIKILYYLGLVMIGIGTILAVFQGLALMRHSFAGGLGSIIMCLIGAVVGVVFWRFLCEIYMLFFRMSDDLRDIKNQQLGIKANEADIDIDL